jgi:hypothetical protein
MNVAVILDMATAFFCFLDICSKLADLIPTNWRIIASFYCGFCHSFIDIFIFSADDI